PDPTSGFRCREVRARADGRLFRGTPSSRIHVVRPNQTAACCAVAPARAGWDILTRYRLPRGQNANGKEGSLPIRKLCCIICVPSVGVLRAACWDEGGANKKPNPPACTDCTPTGAMTFRLPSPDGATVWTATTMDKVLREAAPPETLGQSIAM